MAIEKAFFTSLKEICRRDNVHFSMEDILNIFSAIISCIIMTRVVEEKIGFYEIMEVVNSFAGMNMSRVMRHCKEIMTVERNEKKIKEMKEYCSKEHS